MGRSDGPALRSLALTRVAGGERNDYEMAGVGTVRLAARASEAGGAEAGGAHWVITSTGKRARVATDAAGALIGEFAGSQFRNGGVLRWAGREYELKGSIWRQRYELLDGARQLARLDGATIGPTAVKLEVDAAAALDPGLLLFTAYVVRVLTGLAASRGGGGAGG